MSWCMLVSSATLRNGDCVRVDLGVEPTSVTFCHKHVLVLKGSILPLGVIHVLLHSASNAAEVARVYYVSFVSIG